jgi:hypothetical protein
MYIHVKISMLSARTSRNSILQRVDKKYSDRNFKMHRRRRALGGPFTFVRIRFEFCPNALWLLHLDFYPIALWHLSEFTLTFFRMHFDFCPNALWLFPNAFCRTIILQFVLCLTVLWRITCLSFEVVGFGQWLTPAWFCLF